MKVGREGGGRHRVPFCPPEPRFIGSVIPASHTL